MVGKGIYQVFVENYDLFLMGLLGTLRLSFVAVLFGLIIGTFIALMHLSKNKVLKTFAKIYVEVLRGTPLLVQIYLVYFFLPMAFPIFNLSSDASVVVALLLNSSAYISEVIRGGINSVDKGQTEAAKSLGMSSKNCMVKIILPQAVKNILPALGNEFITMVKETSIAAVFMVNELMFVKTILANQFLIWQPILIVAIIYLIVNIILSQMVGLMERRLSVSD
jgi:His/Glu/Gln/Arg/opine family amino acid ABC transporter permease subunit